jgi:hypothetical protein
LLLNSNPTDPNSQRSYVLTVFKDGSWEKVTPDEYEEFIQQNPQVGQYLVNQQKLQELQGPQSQEDTLLYESWEKLASKMLYVLWKLPQSWIF